MFFIDEQKKEATILLHEDITEELASDVNYFVYGLSFAPYEHIKSIRVSINSGGGSVLGGMSIFSALKTAAEQYGKTITTQIDGLACSIASIIFLAGTIRIARDFSLYMAHNPSGGDDKSLLAIKESIMEIYKMIFDDEDELNTILNNETWYTAEQMKQLGIVNEIIYTSTKDINVIDASKITDVHSLHEMYNKLIKKETVEKMKKPYFEKIKEQIQNLTSKISLKEDPKEEKPEDPKEEETNATEEVETPEEDETEASEFEQLQEQIDALKALVEGLMKEREEMKLENKALKKTSLEDEKKNILVEAGIDSKHYSTWMKLDLETVKSLVTGVPVNKKSPSIVLDSTSTEKTFEQMTDQEKLDLAESNPKKYSALFKAHGEKNKKIK